MWCSTHWRNLIAFIRRSGKAEAGLRINPEHSEGEVEKYDPCAAGSRLGQPVSQLDVLPDGIRGLHMHIMRAGLCAIGAHGGGDTPFLEAQKGKLIG